ncbi:AAA family ATPase [Aldersonia kunmingensis]|uniref:AAA family ATPase n=1 Tax=Aldersonia kunmingensis TaxID=408066 RepID=UPI00082EAFD8|nr:AAA family ATPase [Aldersonia kunmingensis]
MENAKTLCQIGWHPLPIGNGVERKALRASGITGWHGEDVTDEAVFREWADRWAADNRGLFLATRMPVGVIGIDVDCYDGKPGAQTLAEHELNWGALPPTWSVTARADGSRKLFFRVPEGWIGRGALGPGVEILQRHHRYAVVPPSPHHTGSVVKAYAPDGHDSGQLPPPGDLPELPQAWCEGLARDATPLLEGSPEEANALLGSFRDGPMSDKVVAKVNHTLTEIAMKGSRYDTARDDVMGLTSLGWKGERGVSAALRTIETEYVAAVADKRGSERIAREEFERFKIGAARKIAGDPDYRPMDWYSGDMFNPDGTINLNSGWAECVRETPIWGPGKLAMWAGVAAEPSQAAEGEGPGVRFAAVPASELAGPIPPMQWLVEGVWPLNSFGPLGGEKKTLKSYNLLSLSVAVASGQPFYDKFEVANPGPVLYYAGEGGRDEHQRRLQVIARAYGVPLEDLPLHTVFDAGGLDDPEFVGAMRDHLDYLQPRLVVLDPLYAFHAKGIEAQNLYDRGRMLSDFNRQVGNETSLIIADHFNKTGKGNLDLDSIAQAGMSQWADSWMLQRHREPPDMDGGEFRLAVQFGSRRWGGREWNLDWSLPSAEAMERGEAGEVGWKIERAASSRGAEVRESELALRILRELWKSPGIHTKSELTHIVPGRNTDVAKEIHRLIELGLVHEQKAPRPEGKRTVNRNVLFARELKLATDGDEQ